MMPQPEHYIIPDWPAPARVHALQTTRQGGFSQAPYDTLNFAMHVEDDALTVAANRNLLSALLPSEPVWLTQVHGTQVVVAETAGRQPVGDACITRRAHRVCAVLTADCLPVLLCDEAGTVVGAVHAGWRGLANGVLEATVRAMGQPPGRLLAWLGPAIGPQAFEVGAEVHAAMTRAHPEATAAFVAYKDNLLLDGLAGKFLADIYCLARLRLNALGIRRIYGGVFCTYRDAARFYSYRRDGRTGRMATLIWMA